MNDVPDLRQLRCFVAVAEERHFGRAAARLGIQQPPLSQQIQRLERLLGTVLLIRRPAVQLTDAGDVLLDYARLTLAQATRAFEATRRAAAGHGGGLDVGFAASVLPAGLARAVIDFRRLAPEVDLRLHEMSSAAQFTALRNRTIDVGLVREAGTHPDVQCDVVFRERLVAVVPPGHELARHRSIHLSALASEPFVHFPREVAPGLYDRIAGLCHSAGFIPSVHQEASEWMTIIGLVHAGLGVTLAPASFGRLRWGAARYVPLRSPRDRHTSIAMCQFSNDQSASAKLFADAVRKVSREQKPSR